MKCFYTLEVYVKYASREHVLYIRSASRFLLFSLFLLYQTLPEILACVVQRASLAFSVTGPAVVYTFIIHERRRCKTLYIAHNL